MQDLEQGLKTEGQIEKGALWGWPSTGAWLIGIINLPRLRSTADAWTQLQHYCDANQPSVSDLTPVCPVT